MKQVEGINQRADGLWWASVFLEPATNDSSTNADKLAATFGQRLCSIGPFRDRGRAERTLERFRTRRAEAETRRKTGAAGQDGGGLSYS
jgi:hypothetical protein